MKKICLLILLFIISASAKPVLIQYSTYLTDADMNPRTDISGKSVYFRLYDAQTGGNKLWEELQTVILNSFYAFTIKRIFPIPG